MPQIEQVQVVHWGPLRPDPVDLATDGINVAAGPNGSGKTTLLDAIKLMLGVTELRCKHGDYVYDGCGDSSRRAERAWIKVTFANPERDGRAGRVFADAGRGCELSPYVTAVCDVSRDGKRRYAIVPDHVPWGGRGRNLEADVQRFAASVPSSRWMGPRRWSELLHRAGVSRALLGVISMRQGETDKAIDGTPMALLKRILELTGKQETLDEFRGARARLREVREQHAQAERELGAERSHLRELEFKVQRHTEWVGIKERLSSLTTLELPAARHADSIRRRDALRRERDGFAARVEADRSRLAELDEAIPSLDAELQAARARVRELEADAESARRALSEAAAGLGRGRALLAQASDAVERVGRVPSLTDVDRAAGEAGRAERDLAEGTEERERLDANLKELRAGRPVLPDGLEGFRAELATRGISTCMVAETLDAPDTTVAEAVLGDGVWALVVPADRHAEAVEVAVEAGHRFPIVREGSGRASGALASLEGPPEAGAWLEEVDLPLATDGEAPAVTGAGVVRGRTWAAWRAPERPVLGAVARERAIAEAEARLAQLHTELPDLERAARGLRERERLLRDAHQAGERIPTLEARLAEAEEGHTRVEERAKAIQRFLGELQPRVGGLEKELETDRTEATRLERELAERGPRLETYDRDLASVEQELASALLTTEQSELVEARLRPDADVRSLEVLEDEHRRLCEEVDDTERYPEDVRGEIVLATRDGQARTVEEVALLLEGRSADLAAVEEEVARAAERYTQHIRQVVHLLARRFREVCDQAGMDGDIELVASEDVEGEFGIDIKVAHEPGDPKRSYRSPAHSGGQRAKMSILLLLAAMGLEGSADLLVMDEHTAHLDSRNIDYVAEVMRALRDRVQFVLATPTNAEAYRLGWCDHQLVFYPREPGDPYAPPIRLLTRLPEPGRRYAAMGQLSLDG